MRKGRIDYRMQRRAQLRDLAEGLRSRADVCDAHPDLVRAGTHLAEPAGESCPVCGDDESLRHVTYVFYRKGPKRQGGSAVRREALANTVAKKGDSNVYTVEVCIRCHWHHLLESYWLLRPRKTAPPRKGIAAQAMRSGSEDAVQ